jgi:cell fate (sporulation/competence/biofilm development) regulator YmcA (YheA/YmcA/DUF963 family)
MLDVRLFASIQEILSSLMTRLKKLQKLPVMLVFQSVLELTLVHLIQDFLQNMARQLQKRLLNLHYGKHHYLKSTASQILKFQ